MCHTDAYGAVVYATVTSEAYSHVTSVEPTQNSRKMTVRNTQAKYVLSLDKATHIYRQNM